MPPTKRPGAKMSCGSRALLTRCISVNSGREIPQTFSSRFHSEGQKGIVAWNSNLARRELTLFQKYATCLRSDSSLPAGSRARYRAPWLRKTTALGIHEEAAKLRSARSNAAD